MHSGWRTLDDLKITELLRSQASGWLQGRRAKAGITMRGYEADLNGTVEIAKIQGEHRGIEVPIDEMKPMPGGPYHIANSQMCGEWCLFGKKLRSPLYWDSIKTFDDKGLNIPENVSQMHLSSFRRGLASREISDSSGQIAKWAENIVELLAELNSANGGESLDGRAPLLEVDVQPGCGDLVLLRCWRCGRRRKGVKRSEEAPECENKLGSLGRFVAHVQFQARDCIRAEFSLYRRRTQRATCQRRRRYGQ